MTPLRPVPGLPIEQQPEAVLRRMLCWGEARGEGPFGQLAVLWVVRNRAEREEKSEIKVMLAPAQFSSFNPGDPNRAKLLTAFVDDPAGWSAADTVATLFEGNATRDPTLGATHFYNPAAAHPAWGRGSIDWQETVVIRNHAFGRLA